MKDFCVVDPTEKELKAAWLALARFMNANKGKRILVIYLFAGHGVETSSDLAMVVNEYDEKTEFYKLSKSEYKVKYQARLHPKSFNLAFFSCCRELYKPERKHKNGLPGPRAEAEAFLAARA